MVFHGPQLAFELKQIVWRLRKPPRGTDDSVVREHFAHETVLSWLLALPIRPGLSPLASVPSIEDYLLTMMAVFKQQLGKQASHTPPSRSHR